MNDLPSKTAPVVAAQSSSIMALIPTDLEGVGRMAQMVVQSGLAPKGLDNVQAVGTAILYGLEIGMKPMAAIQKIAVINGRATVWGDAALALIMASGQLDDIEETIDTGTMTARCTMTRKGRKQVMREFSKADAEAAGLWNMNPKVTRRSRDGRTYEADNDSPWRRFPKRMLQMRARGWCARDTFPDVLGGLYIREEIEGDTYIDVTPNEPPAPPEAATAAPGANEPPPPPVEASVAPADEPPVPPATEHIAVELPATQLEVWRNAAGGATSQEELDERWNALCEPYVDAWDELGLTGEATRLYRLNKGRLTP
jgi:hypothetical protein